MEKKFKNQTDFITFIESLDEEKNSVYTKEEVVKLKSYSIPLFDHFLWKRLDCYLKLFKSFLNYEISGDKFAEQFLTLRAKHIYDSAELLKQLELMSLIEIPFGFLDEFNFDLNAVGFTDIIDSVEQTCDSFISDELLLEMGGPREKGEIDDDQFREKIKKVFLLISKV